MGGNFKAMCVNPRENNCYTAGRVYEIKNGRFIDDKGNEIPGVGILSTFEDLTVYSMSEWKEVVDAQTIIICQKGRKVIAVMADADGKYLKSAKARYNPDDEKEGMPFSFEYGVKLALARLFNPAVKYFEVETVKINEKKHSSFDWSSFKSGKFAVYCDTEEKAREFLNECDAQGIKWCTGGKASATNYGATCYVHRPEYTGLTYGKSISNVPTIDYIPSKPTVKEVKRPAKVGEWIKVIPVSKCIYKYGKYEPGDVVLITKIYNEVVVEGNNNGTTCRLLQDEYVVLENYQPDNTPIDSKTEPEQPISSSGMREVKRVAKVGEYVRIVSAQCVPKTNNEPEYQNGDVVKIIGDEGVANLMRYAEGTSDDGTQRILRSEEYIVLENFDYSVFPKNEPWRKAKVGDKIKVIRDASNLRWQGPSVKEGDVLTVGAIDSDGIRTTSGNYFWDKNQEYIITEEAESQRYDNQPLDTYTDDELIDELRKRVKQS